MNDTRQQTDFRTDTTTTTRPAVYTTANGEPSLSDLVVGLTNDVSTLVRKEVDLAKAEVQESVKKSTRGGAMIGAGGMVAYAGLLFLLAAAAIALGDWWENLWLGAAVVGLVTALLGWAILNGGIKQLKHVDFVPRRTMHSLERDAEMAKEKLS
jgi:predicted phage tail protein